VEDAVVARRGVKDAFSFDASLWLWDARKGDSWFFITVPPEISEEIGVRFGARAAGFGSIKVEVTIGKTTWSTSIFPEAKDKYVLPIKKAVRKAESLDEYSVARVNLRVTAPQ
jgi:hypothetical protein